MKEFVIITKRTFAVTMRKIMQIEVEAIEQHHVQILEIIKY